VPYVTQATGAGRFCEIEGMTPEGREALLFACKTPRTHALAGHLTVLRWSLGRRALDSRPYLFIPLAEVTQPLKGSDFRPSELVRTREGHYLVLASREHAIVELTGSGEVVAVASLRHHDHPQAEGLGVGADGALLVADEGAGRRGTLRVYRPRSAR
jgi:hypothetical protein